MSNVAVTLFEGYIPKDDGSVNALGIFKTYAAGTTTPKATYPTYADALAGTNPNPTTMTLGSNGYAFFYLAGAYKIDVQDTNGVSLSGWPKDNIQGDYITQTAADLRYAAISSPVQIGSTSGSGSAYVISPVPAWTSYSAGKSIIIKPNFQNSGAPTINVSGLGAINVVDENGNNLPPKFFNSLFFYEIQLVDSSVAIARQIKTYASWQNISGTISSTTFDLSNIPPNCFIKAVTASGEFLLPNSITPPGADTILSATATTITFVRATIVGTDLKVEQRVWTSGSGFAASTFITMTSVWTLS